MARRSQFICQHCGRRVFAEGGPLTQLRLCRSCFEKARAVQRQEITDAQGREGNADKQA